MLTHMYQYDGIGKPLARFDVHGLFMSDWMKVVVMSPDEEEFLYALQLVHGKELLLVDFQVFHDYGWADQKRNPLDLYMRNVACSIPHLTDLMVSPYGDLKWKKVLQERERKQPRWDASQLINFKGFF